MLVRHYADTLQAAAKAAEALLCRELMVWPFGPPEPAIPAELFANVLVGSS